MIKLSLILCRERHIHVVRLGYDLDCLHVLFHISEKDVELAVVLLNFPDSVLSYFLINGLNESSTVIFPECSPIKSICFRLRSILTDPSKYTYLLKRLT